MILIEAIPLSLGIALEGDCFDVIIPRLTRIPCEVTKPFFTIVNDQFSTCFEVKFCSSYYSKKLFKDLFKVYEGERKIASKNNFLGTLFFDGLTPGVAASVKVLLTMSIDRNGVNIIYCFLYILLKTLNSEPILYLKIRKKIHNAQIYVGGILEHREVLNFLGNIDHVEHQEKNNRNLEHQEILILS